MKNIDNAFAGHTNSGDGKFIEDPSQDGIVGRLLGYFNTQMNQGFRWLLRQVQDLVICLAMAWYIIRLLMYIIGCVISIIIGKGLSAEARERMTRLWNHFYRCMRYACHLAGMYNWNEADRFHAVQLNIVIPPAPQQPNANIL